MMSNYSFAGIVLASESPRRKQLLKKMGLIFRTIPSKLVELPPMGDIPNSYAARLAMEKAVKVGQVERDSLVIGADTVVSLFGNIMGKPKNAQEASLMLSSLSGRWHEVWTGICVYNHSNRIEIMKAVKTEVQFRELNLTQIEEYIETGEPMDKAGAYGIQGKGNVLVKSIKGSYHNVVGLPTYELGQILHILGVTSDSNFSEAAY